MMDARCLWRERCDLISGVVRLIVRGIVCVSEGGRETRGDRWRLGAVILGKRGGDRWRDGTPCQV